MDPGSSFCICACCVCETHVAIICLWPGLLWVHIAAQSSTSEWLYQSNDYWSSLVRTIYSLVRTI